MALPCEVEPSKCNFGAGSLNTYAISDLKAAARQE